MKANERLRVGAWVEGETARFRVWAPDHRKVALVLFEPDGRHEARTVTLTSEGGGYFAAALSDVGTGALYKYRLDDEGPFPDPASRAQPLGVHGPSQLVSHDHPWTDSSWKGLRREDLVLYEVHVGTATREGTFDALIPRLPEIRALGITALELMPLASFPGARNWGYDGVSLYAPSEVYGGPAGLARLIDAAHALGLGVIIDAVYNHLGPDGNYLRAYAKPYFTDRHHTPWGDAVNLDGESSGPVREFLLANAEMWIRDYHADGLRLDATHALIDESTPHILSEIAVRAREAGAGRGVIISAEDERNEARLVLPDARGGYGLDAVWADDFHHQMRRAFAGDHEGYYSDYGGTAEEIAQTLNDGWFYTGQRSAHLGRARGTSPRDLPPPALVHCIQNHDQVGNRALGDRLGKSVSRAAYRAMSALLLLSPYTPLIFMGQEWDATTPFQFFTDHGEELGRLVTRGRREEFAAFVSFSTQNVPDPQSPETFARSVLDWDERLMPEHRGVLALYADLLRLRAEHPCLRARARGEFEARAITTGSGSGVVLERRAGDARLLVVTNVKGPLEFTLEGPPMRVLAFTEDPKYGGTDGLAGGYHRGTVQLSGPATLVLAT